MKEITRKKALSLLEILDDTDVIGLAANVIDENEVDIAGEIDVNDNSHDVDLWVKKLCGNARNYALIAAGIAVRNPLFSVDIRYSGIVIRQYVMDAKGELQSIGSLRITYSEKVEAMYHEN